MQEKKNIEKKDYSYPANSREQIFWGTGESVAMPPPDLGKRMHRSSRNPTK